MEDDRRRRERRIKAVDYVSPARRGGIAFACGDDRSGGTTAQTDVERRRRAVNGGVHQVEHVGFKAEHDGFGLRITPARVELQNRRHDATFARHQHDAAKEDAAKRCAFRTHAVDGALGDITQQFVTQRIRQQRVRGVRSHAAGIRAEVAVEQALVVLGGRDGASGGAVAEGKEGKLLAVEKLFQHERAAQGEKIGCGLLCLLQRSRDDHAFARGKAVCLDDDRCGEPLERSTDLLQGGTYGVARGRDAVALHETLGEGLRALETCGGAGWTEDAYTCRRERIHDACRERHFRADDDEVRCGLRDYAHHVFHVRLVCRKATRDGRDTGITGSTDHIVDTR